MDVPYFLEHGRCFWTMSFSPPLLLWWLCQEFEAQQGLISNCFADTLLLIVPHGHMCKFLVVGEKFIFMRKIFWIPEYFLVFLGLVGIHIKTYFILRYTRYAIKSDYWNQTFELCLRFFLSYKLLETELIKSYFLFLRFEFFSRTRGGAEAIRQPACCFLVS